MAENEHDEPLDPDPEGVRAEPAPEPEIEQLARERDEYKQSWQRAAADYQNLRRRLQSDVDAAVQRAKLPLLQELLLVLDYLDMALAAPASTADAKALHAGVEMTRTALLRALEREGVTPVPDAPRFDAAIHQAIESVPGSGRPAGEVLATVRRGYVHGGQVLRPAQVRVAAGPAIEDGDEPQPDDAGS